MSDGEHAMVGVLPASPPQNIVGCKILLQEFALSHDPIDWDYMPRFLAISKYQVVSGPSYFSSPWGTIDQSLLRERKKWDEIEGRPLIPEWQGS